MPKNKGKGFKIELGTGFFLAILLISAVAAWADPEMVYITITLLVLAICGAIVAILNIRISEERDFLIGVTALILVLFAMNSIAGILGLPTEIRLCIINLLAGFGASGFIVALSHIAKVGLKK